MDPRFDPTSHLAGDDAGADAAGDGVAVRTLVMGDLPLLVATVGDRGRGPRLHEALRERGLLVLAGFIGTELPRGARVGFMLDADALRLVDERDDTLLRAARAGIDTRWVEAACRLRGTMIVVLRGATPRPDLDAAALAAEIDRRAHEGQAWGAIVGVAEERPTLPLMFS